MEPLGVGLHIIYGRMGSGKTNFAIGDILQNTTYTNVVLNVPLCPEAWENSDKHFTEFKKLEPEKVIRLIDEEHQNTLFIVDEAQMVLLSANKILVDSFLKKMSQIRQNNQCVVVIAQISKMLPQSIKDLAESCFFFQNKNVKGIQKESEVKRYRTGYDYASRMIGSFTWHHIYGLYESTNTPTTEKPQNLYKGTYIKLSIIFGVAFILFVIVGFKAYSFISSFSDNVSDSEQTNQYEQVNMDKVIHTNHSLQSNDSLCVRSWQHLENQLVRYIDSNGLVNVVGIGEFSLFRKCTIN